MSFVPGLCHGDLFLVQNYPKLSGRQLKPTHNIIFEHLKKDITINLKEKTANNLNFFDECEV